MKNQENCLVCGSSPSALHYSGGDRGACAYCGAPLPSPQTFGKTAPSGLDAGPGQVLETAIHSGPAPAGSLTVTRPSYHSWLGGDIVRWDLLKGPWLRL